MQSFSIAQNTLKILVKDAESKEALAGAAILEKGRSIGTITDANGFAILKNLPDGKTTIAISFIGYSSQKQDITLPYSSDTLQIFLVANKENLEEVTVTSTRSSRTIDEIPTRIELIAGEELDEKSDMNAGNISTLLRESPGIQVQQTSATSGNMNFRIQGLDGRYTQLLQNGLPLYSGFASGLSVMQIPPLDLKRVEIIKGSSSTLYGGGAIAGMVNLISKEPTDKRETLLQLTGTSVKGADLNGFHSQKLTQKLGVTLFSSYNYQQPYDPNNDQFSDIPLQRRFSFNPRLFYDFSEKTKLSFGVNTSFETRKGGYIPKILNQANAQSQFLESNESSRISTQFKFDHRFGESAVFYAKNSISSFDRTIVVPDYQFSGKQLASFSEIGLAKYSEKIEWVGGVNLWTEQFKEKQLATSKLRDYSLTTLGAFVQNTYNFTPKIALESGLRLDYQQQYGAFLLPRVSLYYRFTDDFSMRLGGGLGYKSPTIFLQESEQVSFRNVLPISVANTKVETSQGLNWDFNYKTTLGEKVEFSLNQFFYYTQINSPLVLNRANLASNIYSFENAIGNVNTKGFETNIRLNYEDFKFYSFYTLIDTKRNYFNLNNQIPLTARHRVGLVLMYEKEDNFRIGYEAYYTGQQQLSDNSYTRDYVTMGFMAEKRWDRFGVYINFENFTDIRQSRWQAMYTGTIQRPQFSQELYAPTDGRVISLGIKIKL